MGRLRLVRLGLRLRGEQGRHGGQTQGLHQRGGMLLLLLLLRLGLMMVLLCRVAGVLDRLLVPRQWTSLGLLDAGGREVHVGVADPLPVQLLLRPEQLAEADRQLALAALRVLRP